MLKRIPVYLITGFMDSGKTTMINEFLFQGDFSNPEKEKILLIVCEDGDTEYDVKELKSINAEMVMIEDEERFRRKNLEEMIELRQPDVVFIEYNGMWEYALIAEELPTNLFIAQTISVADATTFEMYMMNMRVLVMEQMFMSDAVIFNRCDDQTPKNKFRSMIKTFNRSAQIIYERADGKVDEGLDKMPFDLDAEVIEITDADYALWMMDCMEHPENYANKTVHITAMIYKKRGRKFQNDQYIPGRMAMTCCVDDIQFLGLPCRFQSSFHAKHKEWFEITAKMEYEEAKEYNGKIGPVLYPVKVVACDKPEDEMVYFS